MYKIILLVCLITGVFCSDLKGSDYVKEPIPQVDTITFFLLRGIGRESGHWGSTFQSAVRKHFPKAEFVLMDLPGAGEYYNKPALSTIEKMADFLRAQHLNQIDSLTGKKVIVATSLAGNVALEWVTQYPVDFHGAILLSTSLKGICNGKDRVKPEAKEQFVNIFLIDDVAKREEEFMSINSNLNVGNDSLLTAWQEIQQKRPVSRGALLKQTVAGMVYKPEKCKPLIPVLLVGSKADKIVATECFENVAKEIGSELYLHDRSGHGLPVDVPYWLADTSSYWVQQNVLAFNHPLLTDTTKVETRKKGNGLLRWKWLDKGTHSAWDTSEDAFEFTGQSLTDSWQWVEDGVDWLGRFIKELDMKNNTQRQQFKAIRKQLKEEQKGLKKLGDERGN